MENMFATEVLTDSYTLGDLAEVAEARLVGDPHFKIRRVATLRQAQPGDLTFLTDSKHKASLINTHASAVLLDESMLCHCSTHALVASNPKLSLVKLLNLFYPTPKCSPGIHPSAVIATGCVIDISATVGPHVIIEENVTISAHTVIEGNCVVGARSQIGLGCHLYSRVTLYPGTQVGNRTIIHSGAVIGADGFGFVSDEIQQWIKIPQLGNVIIGEDVEIGANTTIDRGTLEDTIIGNGVKLDNLIMIAHNVRIGDHTIIAAETGIAGSATIGRHCMIGGSVGITGHISICDYVTITATSLVGKSIKTPGVYSGRPLAKAQEWQKILIYFRQLPHFYKRLLQLEKHYDELAQGRRD